MARQTFALPGAVLVYDDAYFKITSDGLLRLTAAGLSDLIKTRVYNDTGAPITAGQLLYVKTVNADTVSLNVGLADASGGTVRAATLVADEAIAATSFGNAVAVKVLTGVNTAAGANGDPVYLSATAGGWSLSPPTGAAPVEPQVVGYVLLANAAGSIRFTLPESSLPTHTHQDAARGGQIPTAGVVDGILSADAAGRLKTANGYFDDDATVLAKFGRGLQRDQGQAATGYIRGVGNVTALDTITLTSGGVPRVYEFTAGAGTSDPSFVEVPPGGPGPWAPHLALSRFTSVLNLDAGRFMDSVDWPLSDATSAGVSLVGLASAGAAINLAVATTVAGALVRSGASTTAQAAASNRQVWQGAHSVTADNLTAWLAHAAGHGGSVSIGTINSTVSPRHANLFIKDSTGIIKSPNTCGITIRQANGNQYAVEVTDDVAVIAATDQLSWIAWS